MSPTRIAALGSAALAALVALCISIGLNLFSDFDVHHDIITLLTGTFSGCGVGWIFSRAVAGNTSRVLGRIDELEANQHVIRTRLATLPGAVDDQVEARVAEDRIRALRDLAQNTNGHRIARLRSIGE